MGQQADSGRNASLDDQKARAVGRQDEPREKLGRERGKAQQKGGAFGEGTTRPSEESNEQRGNNLSHGGGGGGASDMPTKD